MDRGLLQDFVDRNQPFEIEVASGRRFLVPHRDFISFSPRKTAVYVAYEEAGEEHFAAIPLLTITSVSAKQSAQS